MSAICQKIPSRTTTRAISLNVLLLGDKRDQDYSATAEPRLLTPEINENSSVVLEPLAVTKLMNGDSQLNPHGSKSSQLLV